MSPHLLQQPYNPQDTLVIVLAGGQGSRLYELTSDRAKPGLEFAGNFRIIDFSLSNCINSGLKQIGVLTQYKSRHLMGHLIRSWTGFHQGFGEFLELLPASQQVSKQWYQGTADALYQNAEFIEDVGAKYTLILAGDHVYKMDYRPFIKQHYNAQADMSVACMEVPLEEAAGNFGVMEVDENNQIIAFKEKPAKPTATPDSPDHCLASMGIYLFDTKFLLNKLRQDANNQLSDHDFGKNIIPNVLQHHNVHAYRFTDGSSSKRPFWRDVGTLDSYWQTNMCQLDSEPQLDLQDSNWPIWSKQTCMSPVRILDNSQHGSAQLRNTLLTAGSRIDTSFIKHSVICSQVTIERNASICDSVILPNAKIGQGAIVHRAIIDKGCVVPAGMEIGVDNELDRQRGFRLTENGIVLVCQKMLDKIQPVEQVRQEYPCQFENIKTFQREMFSVSNGAYEESGHQTSRSQLQ